MECKLAAAESLKYGRVTCPEFWGRQNEVSPFYRYYYALGGEAYYMTEDTLYRFKPNSLYILPIFTRYDFYHNSSDPFQVIFYHVETSPVMTDGLVEITGDEVVDGLFPVMSKLSESGDLEKVEILLTVLTDYLVDKGYCHPVYDPRLARTIGYIEEHLHEPVTVEELSSVACLERAYFTRLFKKVYGISPMEYVLRRRIAFACKEISRGKTASDIASRICYSDEKAFSRSFRRVMGVSMSQYKKSHLLQP